MSNSMYLVVKDGIRKTLSSRLLVNKLGITVSYKIDKAELVFLEQLYQSVFEEHFREGQLSVTILKSWHYH